MIKNFFLAAVLSLVFAATTTAQTVADDDDARYAVRLLQAGTEAPDFTLQTPEGREVSLSDLRGQYVVLDFWASWCPDCRKDIPALKALYERYGQRPGVAFLGVSFDTDKDLWTKCIKDYALEWMQVSPLRKWKTKNADGTQRVLITVAADYRVEWIPSMYLIDPDGKVVFGTVMLEKIEKALEKVKGQTGLVNKEK